MSICRVWEVPHIDPECLDRSLRFSPSEIFVSKPVDKAFDLQPIHGDENRALRDIEIKIHLIGAQRIENDPLGRAGIAIHGAALFVDDLIDTSLELGNQLQILFLL